MRIERPGPDRDLVNLTPLIDVVFNLLIFFMLTGAITAAEVLKVEPASSTSAMRGNVEDTVILVDEKGGIAIGDRMIPADRLSQVVRDTLDAHPEALIQVKPDGKADAAHLIDVMEAIRKGGAEYIALLTVQKGKAAP